MSRARKFPRIFGLAVVAAGVLAPIADAGASGTLDRIRETSTIRFAYRDGAAPFSFKDRSGRVLGYSVELCTRIAGAIQKDLGVRELKVEWIPAEAGSRFELVSTGKADAECGTSTITLSREKRVGFSVPIFVDGGSALVLANSKIARIADLKGKRIAVIAGTTTEQALVKALNAVDAKAVLVPVANSTEGMAMLTGRKADAYAGDRIVLAKLRSQAEKPAELAFLANDFSYEPYGIVVPREDADFRLAVDRALAGIYRSGEIDTIFQRWLAPLGKPGPLLHAMFYLNTIPE